MAECYSNLYNMRITGLRFFTVYGPWGRPDMALSIFTRSIIKKNLFQSLIMVIMREILPMLKI